MKYNTIYEAMWPSFAHVMVIDQICEVRLDNKVYKVSDSNAVHSYFRNKCVCPLPNSNISEASVYTINHDDKQDLTTFLKLLVI